MVPGGVDMQNNKGIKVLELSVVLAQCQLSKNGPVGLLYVWDFSL